MSDNQNKDDLTDACAKISKVSKKSNGLAEKGAFIFLCIICVIIFVVMVMPSKASNDVLERSDKNYSLDTTLKDNLDEAIKLNKLKELQKQAQLNKGKKPFVLLPAIENPTHREVDYRQAKPKISKDLIVRMNAPTTFLTNDGIVINNNGNSKDVSGVHEASILSNGSNGQFLNGKGKFGAVEANQMAHPDYTVPAGELIPATLETAINSELPGMVRAITTRDIYSLTDFKKLIPRGSSLVGQFNSGVVQGQSRILIIWNRLQLPNGVIVALNSPGTDSIGRSGQGADNINRHFFQRFGSSVMLSLLGYFSANNGVGSLDQMNSQSQFKTQIANSMQAASGAELEQNMGIKPTLDIHQGAKINIFVANDLSFYQVMREAK